MPVVMVIAILAVVGVTVFAFRGRFGEMSAERNDYVPLDLGPVSATDVALLRPPTALWGYNVQATDEAMDQIAESIRERDVRIVALEQLVTDLGRDHVPMTPLGSPYPGARHRRSPDSGTADTEALRWQGTEPARQAPERSWEGQEPSWQEQEQPWRDREAAWQPDEAQPDQAHPDQEQPGQEQQGQAQPGQEQQGQEQPDQELPWQQRQDLEEPRQQEREQPWQQEDREAPWQVPELPWRAAEPPRGDSEAPPRGDSQAPPPERSHD